MQDNRNERFEMKELSLDELDAVSGGRISCQPLLKYLEEHDISLYQMIKEGVLTVQEVEWLRADHNFRLDFVGRMCEYLGCQPKDIMERIPESY